MLDHNDIKATQGPSKSWNTPSPPLAKDPERPAHVSGATVSSYHRFMTGQFNGEDIRAEIEEIQQAEMGRK